MSGGGSRRLVVLRHGETTHNAAGVWQGQLDSPLSELGEQQVMRAGAAVAALGPVRVVTSDLQRARHTGESVAATAGVPIVDDPRLREIHAGAWQGLTNDEIVREWPEEHAALRAGEDVRRPGGGESLADVRDRVGPAVDDVLAQAAAGECVVLSTHGMAGRMIVAHLLGLDVPSALRMLGGLGNCHWAEVVEGRRGWFLRTWNASAEPAASDPTMRT
ncbi:histidine phosphatase family protein [Phycicoccus sp. CSK15P-2]|uniref:histidine phosphatase family protein n=1 Tax=Phycicoccus sp. CSK15P-2 TaxID=2807627 RepID=UPI00194E1B0A|nr:histidine phosphatase family protein [Phycicoccus sp. CSK15P-2]MBM6404665.1 histidine phosphatase family protein [Phycicoccus sp. CSK15P-2]